MPLSPQPTNYASQRGTAIITALLVVSLVATAATAMLIRLQGNIRRTELLLNADQAYLYAQGSVAWAIDQLNNDWLHKKPNQLIDATPITSAVNHLDNFTIQSEIVDAQANYNLNNASNAEHKKDFSQLVKALAPELSEDTINNLNAALIDWVTPTTQNPAFNNYYMSQHPAYHAPHRNMTSPSELRLLQGMTAELYASLLPYVTALPNGTPININNANAPVLSTLSPDITPAIAAGIVNSRRQSPFTTLAAFQAIPALKNATIDAGNVCVASSYFLLKTHVSVGQQQTILYTLLSRTTEGGKPATTILWQTKGTV